MITPEELGGNENDARLVLVRARSIAPCLDSLTGEDKKNALAILLGVMAELPAAGQRRAQSMSRNGTAITFEVVKSAFSDDHQVALRSLCGLAAATVPADLPVGSFPPGGDVARVWAEGRYS